MYKIRTKITAQGSTIEAAPGTVVGYRDRQTRKLRWSAADTNISYQGDARTILVVALPDAVQEGQTVTVDIAFSLRLPKIQGRYGQWEDVVSLTSWHPLLAYYDEQGWQPTPFVHWHPADFNEAGIYSARVTLPSAMRCGCAPGCGERFPDVNHECRSVPYRDDRTAAG